MPIDPHTLPLLPDDPAQPPQPPAPPHADRAVVWDALCFMQCGITASRVADLLREAGLRTVRGAAFNPMEVRKLLGELMALGQAQCDPQSRWLADRAASRRRFDQLLDDKVQRARWWQGWRALMRFDMRWHLEQFTDETLIGAVRVVVLASGRIEDFERLCAICSNAPVDHPAVLANALLLPFDPARFDRLDPELQRRLLQSWMRLQPGDPESVTAPLWRWLQARAQPDPDALWDDLRRPLALRLLLEGRSADARAVLQGLADAEADALRAAADIVDGQYDSGATAFETALKRAAADSGKRKQLLTEQLTWFYALALLARRQPAQWVAARKFVAGEAGRRDADNATFWGVWQLAFDQRLGDEPRRAGDFLISGDAQWRPPGLQMLSHLLLAAWLGHTQPSERALRALVDVPLQRWTEAGLHWLATLARRAVALLLKQDPVPADAALPFPLPGPGERWREALDAIVALGSSASAPAAKPGAESGRLLWLLKVDLAGRVLAVQPLEQKAGPRGLGKAKVVALSTLAKRTDLPNHDTAVLRAIKKLPWGGKLALDRLQAVQSLVRHPHLAWAEAPDQFIELAEGLPRMEVLTRGDHLQFRVLDPIRPEDAEVLLDEADDDFDDEDDFDLDELEQRVARNSGARRQPVLVFRDGPTQGRLVRVTPAQLRVAELVSQGWQVPTAARTEIDAALRVLGAHFQLASDAEAGHEVPSTAVLRAELTPQGGGLLLHLVAAPFGDFGPRLAPGLGRERVTTVHQGATLSTRRELKAERATAQRLLAAVDGLDDGQNRWPLDEPEQALAIVEALAGLAPDIVTEWPKGKPLRVRTLTARQLTVKLTGKGDWLALDGEAQIDGDEVLKLEALLDLVRGGRGRYVTLREGEFLALGDALRQQLADLNAIAHPAAKGSKAGGQRVAPLAALAWSQQAGAPEVSGDLLWQLRVERWSAAQDERPPVPAGLQAELRDYQLAGWHWLMRLAGAGFGAVLADDMGLGKTLQTLALLLARAAGGPAMVVAPTSVCGNWIAEAARFAPTLRVSQYGDARTVADDDEAAAESEDAGTDRLAARRAQVQALGAHDVLVCSYGLLQRDGELLAERTWHTLVLDEAQAVKNAATQRARAALALPADARVALTGTPVENRLAELWAIMGFANPGLLGSAESFQQRFAGPIERDGDPQASKRLRRLVAPFLLRRTKAEVLADLPPRTEIVHRIVPAGRERALHEALRREAEQQVGQAVAGAESAGQAQMHILAALTRLRRAACDPRLVAPELGIIGAKVQAFGQLAQELVAGKHKALVFSQFTDFLALLRERLDADGLTYQYLDGSTPAAQRTARVNAFQAGEGDFFLISLKAGGFGLNLTMADYVIIADPWWNPAAEDQASGRAHRIGQLRPVTVYRLVTAGSIEDRIVHLHQHKRGLAEGVLAGQDSGGGTLRADELMALLRGEAADGDEAAPAD